jgi:hypothetical protein
MQLCEQTTGAFAGVLYTLLVLGLYHISARPGIRVGFFPLVFSVG